MTPRKLVLLHGIGGVTDVTKALDVLNDHLAGRGYPRLDETDVISVDYERILAGEVGELRPLPRTWTQPPADEQVAAREAYVRRAVALRARLDRTEDESDSRWSGVPEPLGDVVTRIPLLAMVDNYARNRQVRHHVLHVVNRAISAGLPLRGESEIVIVGHSLGTVVAADLIDHLPDRVTVRALITLASPLGFIPRLRENSELMRSESGFPFGRVQAWTNLYSPTDVVTGGRGISHHYRWASDAAIDVPDHGLREHLNHPATLAVLEEALFATYLPARVASEIDRPLDDHWLPQLLAFAWAQRVGEAMTSGDEALRRRLRQARVELARRSLSEFVAQLARLDAQIARAGHLQADDAETLRLLHRHPTQDELVDHPADLLSGRLTDAELTLWLVPIIRSWPVAPFQTADKIPWDQRERALAMLLARVRARDPRKRLSHTDEELAALVIGHIRDSEKALGQEKSAATPWWAVAGVGALALVAVPLTFGASIPAGLTGAAALTAGLAAFGPGGMAGGIATIAVLTGGGAVAATGGVGTAIGAEKDYGKRRQARRMARSARELRNNLLDLPLPGLREALIALLAVIRIGEELGVEPASTRYPGVQQIVDRMRVDARLHEELAPGSDAAKDRRRRLAELERFAALLRPAELSDPKRLDAVVRAILPGEAHLAIGPGSPDVGPG